MYTEKIHSLAGKEVVGVLEVAHCYLTVLQTKISQSLGPNGCDEAAIKAIKSVKWLPAKCKDKPVIVWIAVPVDFKLN